MTLLNDTREHVIPNRQAINNVISSVTRLQTQVQNVTQMIQSDIMELRVSSTAYFQINNFMAEIKRSVMAAKFYIDELQLKFGMLSLGHLSTSLIAPKRLQNILADIKGRLPPHLQLTHDPIKDIWTFYRYLTCTTVISTEHVLVIVSLPLVNVNHKYVIYKVHNLPFPIQSNESSDLSQNMIAYRTLESSYIAVNIERSRYMILRYEDIQQCLTQSLKFCELRLPIYPINLSRLCIVSIFMNEKEGVDKHCQTIVRVNQLLPHSSYIADGFYAIATNKPIQLTQACKQLSASQISVKAPLDIIQLKPSCSMTHRNLILPAYYYKESKYNLTEHINTWINNFKPSQIKIWEPLHKHYPNFSFEKLPSKLKDIKEIKIGDLINKLKELDTVTSNEQILIWPYICLGLGLVSFGIIFGLICYCKCYPKFRNYLRVKRERKVGSHDVTKEVEMQPRTPCNTIEIKPAVPKETPKETTLARRGSKESKLRIPLLNLAATTV